MKDFYALTTRGRALRLRRMALAALERYDLDVRRVRLLTNSTNGIFRVDTAETKYALRRYDDGYSKDFFAFFFKDGLGVKNRSLTQRLHPKRSHQ